MSTGIPSIVVVNVDDDHEVSTFSSLIFLHKFVLFLLYFMISANGGHRGGFGPGSLKISRKDTISTTNSGNAAGNPYHIARETCIKHTIYINTISLSYQIIQTHTPQNPRHLHRTSTPPDLTFTGRQNHRSRHRRTSPPPDVTTENPTTETNSHQKSFLYYEVTIYGKKVLPYVTRIWICLLVGTLVWLLKTLIIKVLASSFHVSKFFDRIQDSLFNQYVIETLSGRLVIEIQKEREEKDWMMEEVEKLQSDGANIPYQLNENTVKVEPGFFGISKDSVEAIIESLMAMHVTGECVCHHLTPYHWLCWCLSLSVTKKKKMNKPIAFFIILIYLHC
ncbi:mechanosensitive channel of small conductance-like 5 [Artemisia annua]|uniref:Mechanosensitive channel of small conductance-like 5 n=1 Tax=Artemisia annua TaxID=35608 RepID=A0A2U1L9U2_ARTAN|nr:mechanosensitive channel of small conductance-like 5 [Artemisia annua]